jgi:hypothetical protein
MNMAYEVSHAWDGNPCLLVDKLHSDRFRDGIVPDAAGFHHRILGDLNVVAVGAVKIWCRFNDADYIVIRPGIWIWEPHSRNW